MVDDSRNAKASEGFATTQPRRESAPPTRESISTMHLPPIVSLPDAGYDIGELIARGGMGEVLEARDRRIGREVAFKRMKSAHPTAEATMRFLREARIQGRLDHPAIVPVHELGIDDAGRPFFTMKRLAGHTLADRLADGGSIQPLLRAFVDVCLAIELAHERGVVHRDLKPSNIMLGDYGEVYVLDWGIARVLAEEERVDGGGDIDTLDEGTKTGAMLGTPGYMSPEQIRSEPVEFSSDVYALGSILFEILAGEPLHPRGTPAIAHTLQQAQQSPIERAPDRAIAPELDRACFAALHEVASLRPRARTLANQVQRYLDGDRDLERRAALSDDLVVQAKAALAEPEGREQALRLAGRALALSPQSAEAAALVTKLLVEPPKVLPQACQAMLERENRAAVRKRTLYGAIVALSVYVFILLIPLFSIHSWGWLAAFYVSHGAVGGLLYLVSRREVPHYIWIAMAITLAGSVIWSRIAGAFVLNPVMICVALLGFTVNAEVMKRRWVAPVWACVAVMAPLVLEWLGVLAPTTAVVGDHLEVHSMIYNIRGDFELAALTVANLMFVLIAAVYGVGSARLSATTQRTLSIQNWQLSHLVQTAR